MLTTTQDDRIRLGVKPYPTIYTPSWNAARSANASANTNSIVARILVFFCVHNASLDTKHEAPIIAMLRTTTLTSCQKLPTAYSEAS